MEWTGFLFLMLALKIPLAALLYLVWWAIRQTPEDEQVPQSGDGGSRVPDPKPRPLPRNPRRRGPHGDPAPVAPPRTRTTVARARTPER
ncbi:MAG: hypothetical protein ACTHOE_02120 [Conexibacter sp.]